MDGHHHTVPSAEYTEKLSRLLDEKEQTIKRIQTQNIALTEKIRQLNDDNREANENIEELDRQHGFAVERLLGLKHEAEDKYEALTTEFAAFRQHNESLTTDLQELRKKYENVEKSYVAGAQEKLQLQTQIDALAIDVRQNAEQNEKLLADLDDKERYEIVKDKEIEIAALHAKLSELEQKLKESQLAQPVATVVFPTEVDRLEKEHATVNQRHTDDLERIRADHKAELYAIRLDKNQIECEFNMLQEDDLLAQKELHDLKDTHYLVLNEFSGLRRQLAVLKEQNEKLQKTVDDMKVQDLSEEFETLKAEASESESLLIQENIILQKQVIDLKSSINGSNAAVMNSAAVFDDLRQLIRKYVKYDGDLDTTKASFEEFLKFVGEQIGRKCDDDGDDLAFALEDMTDENSKLHEDKQKLEHERDTIRADLHHYEVEVAQLMKNNELLLSEIEHLKTSKLETISEHNEDNIVILEKQLEDCSKLNQNLEDEYVDLRSRLQLSDHEKRDLLQRVDDLEREVAEQNDRVNKVTLQMEAVEMEKSNLLFEINELKTDDTSAVLKEKNDEHMAALSSLKQQLSALNSDHADLIGKLQHAQTNYKEFERNSEAMLRLKQTELDECAQLLGKRETDIQELLQTVHELQSSGDVQAELARKVGELAALSEELHAAHDCVTGLTTENQMFSQKIDELRATARNEALTGDAVASLQQAIDNLAKEKAELIALITAKHNENVQYHGEIQRLDQLLTAEVHAHVCAKCPVLQQQLADYQAATAKDTEKLNDQIVFLREKADILTGNLLTEQNNQKRLNQEKTDLNEEKLSLAKDLKRLQEHLMEIEEAHTEETMQLQRQIDETKAKMGELEEDARKSSTLYTSAR